MDDRPFFIREPKWQLVFLVIFGFIVYMILNARLGGVDKNSVAIAFDLLIFLVSLFFWHFFFSQFVLPVQNIQERMAVYYRLWLYLIGRHGPAILIKNGDVRQRGQEEERVGPGIALLDTASAAILRTDVEFTRPIGPGVHFTRFFPQSLLYEYVAASTDLRRRSQILGPDGKEDPFAPRGRNETESAYTQRQMRYGQTNGLTRDGIEVVPNVYVAYKLIARGSGLRTQFEYDERSVRLALTSEGIDPNLPADDDRRRVEWTRLAGLVSVDVWREAVRMFTLDELFQDVPDDLIFPGDYPPFVPNGHRPTGLQFILAYMKQRLTNEMAFQLDDSGHFKGMLRSRESQRLKERGIMVHVTHLLNLRLPAEVDEQLARRWESSWLQQTIAERNLLEHRLSVTRQEGQHKALREFAMASVNRLNRLPPGIESDSPTLLRELMEGTLQLTIRDPQLNNTASNERNSLIDLIAWAQRKP